MKPLTPLKKETAESLAFALADVFLERIQSLFGEVILGSPGGWPAASSGPRRKF